MSELYMHKFVGRAWDEICLSDDHIVPDPANKGLNSHFMLSDSHKKRHFELVSNSSNTRDRSAPRYVDQERDQDGIPPLSKRRNTTLETSNIASESTMFNNRNSGSGDFSGLDTILDDSSPLNYPMGDINHTGNDIKYFGNAENKGSIDLQFCDWPEIENFEDIDTMIRNCDSAFDLVKFPYLEPSEVENISENHEFSSSYSIDDSYRSFVIGPDVADCKDGFIPQEQGLDFSNKIEPTISTNSPSISGSASVVSEQKNQISQQMQSKGKSKEHSLGNYILPSEVGKLSSCITSQQILQSSYGYSQDSISNMHSDDSRLSDPTSVIPKLSLIKSETSDLTSISPRDSSQNIQESSTMRPDLDDISLEAAGFCQQLQLVMEKLDFRTKLCIRDSLYRLAQSAEQRHNLANLNTGCGEGDETNSLMDMETDTNPIDRSVAHLLFHQSSNSSTKLVQDSFPFRPSSAVIGSTESPPVLADNLVSEGN